jgi:Zn-finger nucleic acid-binding protein
MNCPRCGIVLKIADRQGVEVDFCPACRGIWLDRGELDKIIERSMRVSGYAKPTRYDDDDYYGDGYDTSPAKRKRGKTYDDDDYYAPHHHPKHKKRQRYDDDDKYYRSYKKRDKKHERRDKKKSLIKELLDIFD